MIFFYNHDFDFDFYKLLLLKNSGICVLFSNNLKISVNLLVLPR